jgi:CDP-4-dehydro-6-deoxyglucose reductase
MVPYGDFVYKTSSDKKACFVSTGTGIDPFRAMIFSQALKNNPPQELTCLLGVRGDEELLYVDELTQYSVTPSLKLNYVTCVSGQASPKYQGLRGRVTQYLRETHEDFINTEFYLCGAGAMIDEVKKILSEKGVTKEQIHQEVYYKEPKA